MIYDVGSVSQSIDVFVGDDTGLGVTGLNAASFPALTWSLAGANADNAFGALNDLAALTTAYNPLGVKERGGGYYRLDVPNAIYNNAGKVKVRGETTGKHVIADTIEVGPTITAFAYLDVPSKFTVATNGGNTTTSFHLTGSTFQAKVGQLIWLLDPSTGVNIKTITSVTNAVSNPTIGVDSALSGVPDNTWVFKGTLATHMPALDATLQVAATVAGGATAASQTSILNAVNAITSNTARGKPVVPSFMTRPTASSTAYEVDLNLYTLQGTMEVPDAAPTVHARNVAGGSLDAGLSSTTMTLIGGATGRYKVTYNVASTDPQGEVIFDFTWLVGGTTFVISESTEVQDAESLSTLLAIQTTIGAAGAGLTAVGDTAGTTTLLGRLTATRAGYLDNLSGGAVGLASALTVAVDILQADQYIDTTTSPWNLVYIKKGSGTLTTGTVLLRQQIKDVTGANLTASTQIPGSKVT